MILVPESAVDIRALIEATYRADSRRVFSTLVRLVRDFDLAEEAMHEAFAEAIERWQADGVPDNPRAWLVSTGRFKAIDALRRRGRFDSRQPELANRLSEIAQANDAGPIARSRTIDSASCSLVAIRRSIAASRFR